MQYFFRHSLSNLDVLVLSIFLIPLLEYLIRTDGLLIAIAVTLPLSFAWTFFSSVLEVLYKRSQAKKAVND